MIMTPWYFRYASYFGIDLDLGIRDNVISFDAHK
jgi:hypothetical protein